MKRVTVILAASALFAASACSTWRKLDDTERGAVIGGGSGAVLGSAVSPGVGGTLIGGAAGAGAGALIGNAVEDHDRRHR